MSIDFNKLKAPFPPELISWRVGATSKDKTKAIALAYIDARDVMERLDEVCGPGNWQSDHPHANGKTSCRIGIKIGTEWVWKENGCGDSQVEAEKGAFSDSFKRAAVLWGIGRYLYDVANVWVEIEPYGRSYKIKNPNDPKLKKALADAAKGIRGVNEPEPEIKPMTADAPVFPTNEARLEWLRSAAEEVEKIKTEGTLEEINVWYRDNLIRLDGLGEKQRAAMDDKLNTAMAYLSEKPVTNGAAHA